MTRIPACIVCAALCLPAAGCIFDEPADEVRECDSDDLARCDLSDTRCDGDSIVLECTSGTRCSMSCTEVCAMDGQHYTGTCADSYRGQSSSTGDDTCWCTDECVPAECADYNCGTMDDGCGGTLECGGCTPPETCGGGGLPNVCGLPSGECEDAWAGYGYCDIEHDPGAACHPNCYWNVYDTCLSDCAEGNTACQCDCMVAREECMYECNDVFNACLEERGVAGCPTDSLPDTCEEFPQCCGDIPLGEHYDCYTIEQLKSEDTIGCYD